MEARLSDTLKDSSEVNMTDTTLSSVASGNATGGISEMRQTTFEDIHSDWGRYIIKDTRSPSDYGYSPERNINERWASSVESSNPGSVLSPNKAMYQIESNFKDELLQTQMYRKSMQRCFKKIKDNIDIVSMTAKAVKAELVRKEDLSWFKTDKRKKKADLFLTKIIQTIELKNIPKFEEIIGKYIADEIDKCRYDIPSRQEIGTRLSNTKLQRLRKVLCKGLLTDDVENLKDFFIENFIIDIDENGDIIRHPGFVIPRNKTLKFVPFFVDEYIIKKESIGSFQWLVKFLQDTSNSRLSHILLSLIDELNENLDDTEPGSEVNNRLTVEHVDHDVTETQIESKNVRLSLEFQDKDDQTKNVCQKMVSTVKSKTGIMAATFGGIIKESNEGSVIIHLTSLHKYTLQRILNSISHGQFSKVLELLFKDDEIKRILAPGNYKLEMNVCVCDDILSINQKPVRKTSLTQTVKDNRTFLREEMDTLLVLKKFRSQGIDVESDIEDKDRSYRAEYLINIAMSNIEAAESLYSTLKEMSHVQDRFTTYERVYKTDPIHVCKHILNNFSNISEAVDLADIRLVFVERGIFEDKQLDNIENEFRQKRIDVMSVFLAEVMQKGNDAMLTLVDALFVLEIDDLAESLITEYTDIFEEFSLSKESTHSVVKKKDSVLTEVSVASATFVLKVSKGDEYKSIVTASVDTKNNPSKVIQLDDESNAINDCIMQTTTSSIGSPQEQEFGILETKNTGKEYKKSLTSCVKEDKQYCRKDIQTNTSRLILPQEQFGSKGVISTGAVKRQQEQPALDKSSKSKKTTKRLKPFPASWSLPTYKQHNIANRSAKGFPIRTRAETVSVSQCKNVPYKVPEYDDFRLYQEGWYHHVNGNPSNTETEAFANSLTMQAREQNTHRFVPNTEFKLLHEYYKRPQNSYAAPVRNRTNSTYLHKSTPLAETGNMSIGMTSVPQAVQPCFPDLSTKIDEIQFSSVLEDEYVNQRLSASCSPVSETSMEITSSVPQSSFPDTSQTITQSIILKMGESATVEIPYGIEDLSFYQRIGDICLPESETALEDTSSDLPFQYISDDDSREEHSMICEASYHDKSSAILDQVDVSEKKTQPNNFKMGEGLLSAISRIKSALFYDTSTRNLHECQSSNSDVSSVRSSPELKTLSNVQMDVERNNSRSKVNLQMGEGLLPAISRLSSALIYDTSTRNLHECQSPNSDASSVRSSPELITLRNVQMDVETNNSTSKVNSQMGEGLLQAVSRNESALFYDTSNRNLNECQSPNSNASSVRSSPELTTLSNEQGDDVETKYSTSKVKTQPSRPFECGCYNIQNNSATSMMKKLCQH